jgi:hypothetical protein
MEENAEPNKQPTEPPTPDVAQLLKMLDIQASARRQHRVPAKAAFQTPSIRYGILIAIVVFAFGSLGMLEWFLSQLPKPSHPTPPISPAQATSVAKTASTSGNP